jgi:outer membrane protein assembly factor BamD (BamD/ComL family)
LIAEDRLNAEVEVLKRAREELRLGRPAQALEALLEYDRRFGKGVLGEERQAMAAIAACQARPGSGARAQAEAFMRSAPDSPLLDRVRATCITPARPGAP